MSIALQLFLWVCALIVMMSILVGVVRTGISPMPSSQRAIKQILKFVVPPRPGPIYELGAAWGSLVIPLARAFPDRRIIAYELSTIPWLFLRLRVRASGLTNIDVVRRDFFRDDLGQAAAVVCYLYPGSMVRLSTKLKSELSAGTVVVSNTFSLPGWVPREEAELKDLYGSKVYGFVVENPPEA
ncbi:MAG: SAM-dependent methyltransferase [Bradymonadia bacterium]